MAYTKRVEEFVTYNNGYELTIANNSVQCNEIIEIPRYKAVEAVMDVNSETQVVSVNRSIPAIYLVVPPSVGSKSVMEIEIEYDTGVTEYHIDYNQAPEFALNGLAVIVAPPGAKEARKISISLNGHDDGITRVSTTACRMVEGYVV